MVLMLDLFSPAGLLLLLPKGDLFADSFRFPHVRPTIVSLPESGLFRTSSSVHNADIFALNDSSENSSAEHGYPISNFSSTLGCKIPSLPISTSRRLASVPDPSCPSVAAAGLAR